MIKYIIRIVFIFVVFYSESFAQKITLNFDTLTISQLEYIYKIEQDDSTVIEFFSEYNTPMLRFSLSLYSDNDDEILIDTCTFYCSFEYNNQSYHRIIFPHYYKSNDCIHITMLVPDFFIGFPPIKETKLINGIYDYSSVVWPIIPTTKISLQYKGEKIISNTANVYIIERHDSSKIQ